MNIRRRAALSALIIVSLGLSHADGARASTADFPEPASLKPAVNFWKNIFAKYSEHQIVIHDAEHLGRVYAVLDYRDLAASESPVVVDQVERAAMTSEKEHVREVLLALDARGGNDGGLTDAERRIWNLFAKTSDPRKFAAAADPSRIRAQRGLRERFAEGVRVSRRYLPQMEQIFRSEGLPAELTRLPLVESCFNIDAYSKVGAAGIWQFMRSTGRSYMHIGGAVDERRDPLRATHAAAEHLQGNFEALGSWPLAITAYNHGRAGMMHAVSDTGTTDIGTIVRTYHGPLFGFASRNFYAEFLAAVEVERTAEQHFGPIDSDTPFRGDEVRLEQALAGKVAASCAATTPSELAVLNPAVDGAVFLGRGNLPRGYMLRVPAGSAGQFAERLAQVSADARVVPEARTPPTRVAKRSGGTKAKQGPTRTASAKRIRRSPGRTTSGARAKGGHSTHHRTPSRVRTA